MILPPLLMGRGSCLSPAAALFLVLGVGALLLLEDSDN